MTSLTDDALLAILRKEEAAARNYQWSALSRTREVALAYYDRAPYGDEQEGHSQVVTSEFADVIESIMPGLMRVFTSTDEAAEFTPAAPGEERWAREASAYVPHVVMRQNEGFRILYWLIKDALMYRPAPLRSTSRIQRHQAHARSSAAAGCARPDRGPGGVGGRRAGDGAGARPSARLSNLLAPARGRGSE